MSGAAELKNVLQPSIRDFDNMIRSYDPDWEDISDFVVHFTRHTYQATDYDNIISILADRNLIAANPFGIARRQAPIPQTQNSVCFSEIPVHLLGRLAERRGRYGIGFLKQFILVLGGGPVWYVEQGSPAAESIHQLMEDAIASDHPEAHPIWRMTPLIDSPGDYPGSPFRFEWEREWRHVGDFHFTEDDVAFLIIPENLHANAREFFENARRDNLGPAYFCPYIDVTWDRQRLLNALHDGGVGL